MQRKNVWYDSYLTDKKNELEVSQRDSQKKIKEITLKFEDSKTKLKNSIEMASQFKSVIEQKQSEVRN